MAIHWRDFPHKEIFADIYSRLNHNAVEHSADDSTQHILRRRLHLLVPEEHVQFIRLESRHIVERLRCTRDAYRAFTNSQGCTPAAEAYWVILRFAVLPTAIASLKQSVFDYVKLTRVPAIRLSLLFGVQTHACHLSGLHGTTRKCDFDDLTPATDTELEGLAAMVNDDTLLWVEDKRVGHPLGGGPFAIDDFSALSWSWGLSALFEHMTLTDWVPIRAKLWRKCIPWTEGLTTLFGCVQDELLSQWRALPPDGKAQEASWKGQPSEFDSVAVPEQRKDTSQPAARARRVAPGVAQVSLADLNVPVNTSLKETKNALLKLGAPARRLKDPRILEAADYKIKNPKSTYKEVSIKFFRTPERADSIRSWVNKRKSRDGRQ